MERLNKENAMTFRVSPNHGMARLINDVVAFTKDEIQMIHDWESGLKSVQKLKTDPKFIGVVKNLDPYKKTLYRGISADTELKVGDTVAIDRLFSASKSRNMADVYSNVVDKGKTKTVNDGVSTLWIIDGVTGRDIGKYSSQPEHEEVLILPGTKMIVKSVEQNGDNVEIRLRG